MYPTSIDSFTALTNRGAIVTETLSLPSSLVAFKVTTTYKILSNVTFSSIYGTEVVTTPTAGQFRVLYNTNEIEFGPLASASSVVVTYASLGSPILAENTNALQTAVVAIETVLGVNPQGSYTSVAERLTDMSTALSMIIQTDDFSALCDGSVTAFTLTQNPKSSDYVRVFVNGVKRRSGIDYIVSGNTVSMTAAPLAGDSLEVEYFWVP